MELPAELLQQNQESELCEVWPENWDAVVMFCRMSTQWRIGPGGRAGLDYGVLAWLLSLYPTDNPRQLLEDLQVMEVVILTEGNDG